MLSDLSHYFANTVVMVPPKGFCFNEQTGVDNEFQHHPQNAKITENALLEFGTMRENLIRSGIKVLTLEPPFGGLKTPDAVFPNNWFCTMPTGDVFMFPMKTANRQLEVQPKELAALLQGDKRFIRQLSFFAGLHSASSLEGTGVLVFDHVNRRVFCAYSERCNEELASQFAALINYQLIGFNTKGPSGKPIYHTNVMMGIGAFQTVICSEAIVESDRDRVISELARTHDVIDISLVQMADSLCGNVLQLVNEQREFIWVMSNRAYQGYTELQRQQLQTHSKLVVSDITTIEDVGGGSCRCMLAEVLLPIDGRRVCEG